MVNPFSAPIAKYLPLVLSSNVHVISVPSEADVPAVDPEIVWLEIAVVPVIAYAFVAVAYAELVFVKPVILIDVTGPGSGVVLWM